MKGDKMKEEIFNNYYDKIYKYSLSKTKNIEDTKDLVNDIFVAIFSYINKNIEIKKLDNLIWTIASNCWKKKAIMYIKDHNNIYDDRIIDSVPINDNFIDKIIYEDIIKNIDKYQLTKNEEICFLSYYKEDLSIKEISNKYHISESNIKYYLYNSRKKIKEKYHD